MLCPSDNNCIEFVVGKSANAVYLLFVLLLFIIVDLLENYEYDYSVQDHFLLLLIEFVLQELCRMDYATAGRADSYFDSCQTISSAPFAMFS